MPPANTGGEILTLKEVAERLKVTQRTIYRLAGAEKSPALKVGETLRFPRADIGEWIRRSNSTSGGDQSDDATGKQGQYRGPR